MTSDFLTLPIHHICSFLQGDYFTLKKVTNSCRTFRRSLDSGNDGDNDANIWQVKGYDRPDHMTWKAVAHQVAIIRKIEAEQEKMDNIFRTEIGKDMLLENLAETVWTNYDRVNFELTEDGLQTLLEIIQANMIQELVRANRLVLHEWDRDHRNENYEWKAGTLDDELDENGVPSFKGEQVIFKDTDIYSNLHGGPGERVPVAKRNKAIRRLAYRAGVGKIGSWDFFENIWWLMSGMALNILKPACMILENAQSWDGDGREKPIIIDASMIRDQAVRSSSVAISKVYLDTMLVEDDADAEHDSIYIENGSDEEMDDVDKEMDDEFWTDD